MAQDAEEIEVPGDDGVPSKASAQPSPPSTGEAIAPSPNEESIDVAVFDDDAQAAADAAPTTSGPVDDAELDLTGGALMPRVEQMLTRIADPQDRQRWERFFSAAGAAIERLGELDVSTVGGEKEGADGQAAFESVEPMVRSTLLQVGAFLALTRRELDIQDDDSDADLDVAFGDEAAAAPKDDGGADATQKTLRALCLNLAHELTGLEKVVDKHQRGEAWGLLEKLGEFRGRARSGIGEMVFVSARQFAVVRKEDVVPFYKEDVDASLSLRRSIACLRARIDLFLTRLAKLELKEARKDGGESDALRACLESSQRELERFIKDDAYRLMRLVDRRSFGAVLRQLAELLADKKLKPRDVEITVEGLSKFLDSLSLMNQRELLVVHDRDAVADVQLHLARLHETVAGDDVAAARTILQRAVSRAEPLAGRDLRLDGVLTACCKLEVGTLSLDEVLAIAALLRGGL